MHSSISKLWKWWTSLNSVLFYGWWKVRFRREFWQWTHWWITDKPIALTTTLDATLCWFAFMLSLRGEAVWWSQKFLEIFRRGRKKGRRARKCVPWLSFTSNVWGFISWSGHWTTWNFFASLAHSVRTALTKRFFQISESLTLYFSWDFIVSLHLLARQRSRLD